MDTVKAVKAQTGLLTWLNVGKLPWSKTILFLAVHVVLGLAVSQSSALATLHALGTLGLGLWWAATRPVVAVAYAGAYIVGAEVLWRMAEARVPWEFGKYALSLVLLVALIRSRRIYGPLLPLLYFALLLPSCWFTVEALHPGEARQYISFNLSGPFALLVCAWFFSHVRMALGEIKVLFLALIGPVVSILTVALYDTIQLAAAAALIFHGESNFGTSGGFGPNQVSSMLGLAALLCVFYLIMGRADKFEKLSLVALMLLFMVQSALTFSRSGLAMTIGSGTIACFFLMRRMRTRLTILALACGLILLAAYVVVPKLDQFTGEAFSERFTSMSTSHRTHIAQGELQIWQEHPYLGVGPGMGTIIREELGGIRIATHTEFTRLFAEHGVLGMIALVMFFVGCGLNFRRMPGTRERALVATMITWVLLFMLVNAFRLAAPAFLAGLTFASLWLHDAWVMRVQFSKVCPHRDAFSVRHRQA